jgi:hypothetical protein
MTISDAANTCLGSIMLSLLIMFLAANITRLSEWALKIYKSRWGGQ